ncbi:DUF1311 domain-containing protein [Labrys sp. LIt4]|uniref:lysozyme inhibitor LprI family protein n=1 Tax=Labrys sp. LIt4 TaxID=2821355 RepID=UPI001ADF988B|nr:lysozyme inhibitor LprI family protein [Labrys sp. LIt4]MBP0583124.1 DUF1311 domain-containing protein [Labrys sp. LIt4]
MRGGRNGFPSRRIRRNHAAVLLALLAAQLAANPAQAGSANPRRDCKQPGGSVQQAICAAPNLIAAESRIADLYAELRAALPAETRQSLQAEQRAWAVALDECGKAAEAGTGSCLAARMNLRLAELRRMKSQLAIETAVAGIPDDPKKSAETLRAFGGEPRAAAWLAYLARFEPASGVTAGEGDAARLRAVAEAGKGGGMLEGDADPGKDAGLLLLLRLTMQNDQNERLLACPHLFLFKRHGALAYDAFGPIHGSSLDAGAPYCKPADGLFTQPAWRAVARAFEPARQPRSEAPGSIRFAYLARIATEELRMSLQPQDFAAGGPARLGKAIGTIRQWPDNKAWPRQDRERLIAALPAAERQMAQWLIDKRGFTPKAAKRTATGLVATYLEQWNGFVENPDGG